jgi:hypothetical protein
VAQEGEKNDMGSGFATTVGKPKLIIRNLRNLRISSHPQTQLEWKKVLGIFSEGRFKGNLSGMPGKKMSLNPSGSLLCYCRDLSKIHEIF